MIHRELQQNICIILQTLRLGTHQPLIVPHRCPHVVFQPQLQRFVIKRLDYKESRLGVAEQGSVDAVQARVCSQVRILVILLGFGWEYICDILCPGSKFFHVVRHLIMLGIAPFGLNSPAEFVYVFRLVYISMDVNKGERLYFHAKQEIIVFEPFVVPFI